MNDRSCHRLRYQPLHLFVAGKCVRASIEPNPEIFDRTAVANKVVYRYVVSAAGRTGRRITAVIVLPQGRPNVDWSAPSMESQVLAALDATMQEFHGDPRRVYLTASR